MIEKSFVSVVLCRPGLNKWLPFSTLAGRLQNNPEASQRQIATPNKLSPASSQIRIALPGLKLETEKLKTLPNLGNSI